MLDKLNKLFGLLGLAAVACTLMFFFARPDRQSANIRTFDGCYIGDNQSILFEINDSEIIFDNKSYTFSIGRDKSGPIIIPDKLILADLQSDRLVSRDGFPLYIRPSPSGQSLNVPAQTGAAVFAKTACK